MALNSSRLSDPEPSVSKTLKAASTSFVSMIFGFQYRADVTSRRHFAVLSRPSMLSYLYGLRDFSSYELDPTTPPGVAVSTLLVPLHSVISPKRRIFMQQLI